MNVFDRAVIIPDAAEWRGTVDSTALMGAEVTIEEIERFPSSTEYTVKLCEGFEDRWPIPTFSISECHLSPIIRQQDLLTLPVGTKEQDPTKQKGNK